MEVFQHGEWWEHQKEKSSSLSYLDAKRTFFKLARTHQTFALNKSSFSSAHVSKQYLHMSVITPQSRGLHLLGRKEWELEPVMFPAEGVGMLKIVAHV